MILALLSLVDWNSFRPENIFGGQILERTPAGLTVVYSIGVGILIGFLIITFFENIRRHRLIIWQFVFVGLALSVLGFQVYWTYYADESNDQFQALAYKDLRNRRVSAASLRGWMLDRTGTLGASLAYYKLNGEGNIVRSFPLEREMAHLLGTERGTPGLERTLYKANADPMPEAWEILTKYKKPQAENTDVRITIDRDLQTYIAQRLGDKKGGIVVINPQTGDLLAMYSNPTYSLSDAESLSSYLKLEANQAEKPLLNRATREFYIPGSTFKTFTMISAFRANRQNITLPGRPAPECYTPSRGSRPICDAGGSCHACSDNIPIMEAFKVSSNQYFARLANELGRERMGETAASLGIAAVETPDEAVRQGFFPDIWNTSSRRTANALAPARSTIVNGKGLSLYDFGVIGMGQGGAGQMTPFQMALIASAAANLEGKLMKPKIEADLPPQAFAQVLSREQARAVREIMSTVTEEPGGTGGIVRTKLGGTGITTGGKTGTADRDGVQVYNKDGTKKTVKKRKRENGVWVDYDEPVKMTRWDGWFLAIAPLDNPQLAIAVVIEDIGDNAYGGTTAAPIAADVILKAAQLGLLGDQFKSKAPATPKAPAPRRRR